MAFLEETEIESIRSNANIIDIISGYIPLTQKGKNYFGVCPFHEDHSPSMSVSFEKQIYKCFSCGAAGNVFTFIQNYENISFIESVQNVAQKIGYNLNVQNVVKPTKYNTLYKIMDLAEMFYKNNLNTNFGKQAKQYLEKRKINENIINTFNIGLSLNAPNSLYKLLIKKNMDINDISKVGLINIDGERIYDSFTGRIIFPIHNLDGQVVGFTGRIYYDGKTAKYFNSKETEIFKKGNILFNYHRAKEFTKEKHEIIIVEGNMDAIRMYSAGFKNVVALMGTSLTKDQIDIIKRLRSKVILLLDNDDAGENATISNGQLLENNKIEVFVVRLSDYKDPDDYIVNFGADKMQNAIDDKISFIDFKLYYFKKNKDLNQTNDLVEFIKNIVKSMKNVQDKLTKELTIKKLSDDYNIPIELLKDELNMEKKKESQEEISSPKLKIKTTKYEKVCETIVYYMMNSSEYIRIFKNYNIFIDNKIYRGIVNEVLYYFEKYNTITLADFISYISNKDDMKEVVLKIISFATEELNENDFNKCLKIISDLNIDNKIKLIKNKMKNTLDINKKAELANKLIELKKGSVNNERN